MRPARADDPTCLNGLRCPIRPLQLREHAIVPLLQGSHRNTAFHPATELREPIGQNLLGPPLGQAALKFPP